MFLRILWTCLTPVIVFAWLNALGIAYSTAPSKIDMGFLDIQCPAFSGNEVYETGWLFPKSLFGEMIHFDYDFSNGLVQPPTR